MLALTFSDGIPFPLFDTSTTHAVNQVVGVVAIVVTMLWASKFDRIQNAGDRFAAAFVATVATAVVVGMIGSALGARDFAAMLEGLGFDNVRAAAT